MGDIAKDPRPELPPRKPNSNGQIPTALLPFHQHQLYYVSRRSDTTECTTFCPICLQYTLIQVVSPRKEESCNKFLAKIHHFHKDIKGYICCECDTTIDTVQRPAEFLTADLLDGLQSGQGSKLSTGVETLVTYARNAIFKGNERPINTLTEAFQRRFVWNTALIEAFRGIGFDYDADTQELVLSPLSERKAAAQVALEELALWIVYDRDGHTPQHEDDQRYNTYYFPTAEEVIRKIIGANYKPLSRRSVANLEAFKTLGITPDLPDELIGGVYQKQCADDPENIHTYYVALSEISRYFNSPVLQDLARSQRNLGFYSDADVQEAYDMLGATNRHIDDELLITAYQMQIADHSNRQPEAWSALKVIGASRSSSTIEHFLETGRVVRLPQDNKEGLSLEESYELLEASNMDDGMIQSIYITKVSDHPQWKQFYTSALKTIARFRKSDILTQYLREHGEEIDLPMTVEEAYRLLGLVEESIEDDMVIDVYNIRVQDQPSQLETLQKALGAIGEARNSKKILRYIETGSTSAPIDIKNPVGLQNIGNTCYLNSVLQYYFTIKPLREAVLGAEPSALPSRKRKRVGGREISKREVDRSNFFTSHLRLLYTDLIQTQKTSVAPDENLAYLALVSSKDEDEPHAEPIVAEPTATEPSPMEPTDLETKEVLMTDAEGEPTVPMTMPSDYDEISLVPVSEKMVHDGHDRRLDHNMQSEGVEVDIKPDLHSDEKAVQDNVKTMDIDELPTYDSIVDPQVASAEKMATSIDSDATMTSVSGNTSIPIIQNPKQKIESQMMFGRQNDVTECMDNVMFQLEAADGKSVSESDEIIKGLFYGKMRQFLTFVDDSGSSKTHTKDEEFTHIILDVGEGDSQKDLYDGLDEYFYVADVEYQTAHAKRYVTILDLPPILQIQLQRVLFDRRQNRIYKSNAVIKFDKIIYMDRYLDKNHEAFKEKKDQVAVWRQELLLLEQQQKFLENCNGISMHETLTLSAEFLRQYDFLLDVDTPTGLHDSLLDGAEQAQADVEQLREQIASLRTKIKAEFTQQQDGYHVHSVFMHRGQATYGHYWIYIRDFIGDRWFKYNDEIVTEVEASEVMESTGNANPYMITYIRGDQIDFIDTVRREIDCT